MTTSERIEPRVISEVGREVESDIARVAALPAPGEPERLRRVAAELRGVAIDDVVRSDRAVATARVVGVVERVINYLFSLVYALLGLRFLLALIGARAHAGFTHFVEMVTDPPYAPFRNIVESVRLGDGHVLVLSIVVAIVGYMLLHLGLRGLLGLIARR